MATFRTVYQDDQYQIVRRMDGQYAVFACIQVRDGQTHWTGTGDLRVYATEQAARERVAELRRERGQ